MPHSSVEPMKVIAVSHSTPQWLEIGGRKVETSIIHTPLSNPNDSIFLKPSHGISENRSAAHNGEVYVYFAHHYDFWAKKLGVSRSTWDWCHWGENITLRCNETLTEADFHLGDIWKIGKDVVLQVCGSRVPCFKLAWRCGQKDSWLQELAATGKCGIYLKVLRGGPVRPGDEAELWSKGSAGSKIDCATITRTAFADALSTRSTMDLLADDPDLMDMNKLIFRRKLSMLHDQSIIGKNAWKGWRSVYVSQVVDESPDIKSFYMIPNPDEPTNSSMAAYLPGQFITVRLPNGLIRSWSLSTYPKENTREAPGYYRISIRRAGAASTWMHDNCSPGTTLDVRTPAGSFCLDWSPQFPGRQVYASAGIGITPMLAMLRAHLQHQAMQRAPAVWVHVSRSIETMPFQQELGDFLCSDTAQELGIHVMLFLTSSTPSECAEIASNLKTRFKPRMNVNVHSGRPTLDSFRGLFIEPYFMDPLRITPIQIEGRYSTIYLCGPTAFEADMRKFLTDLEVPEPMILSESFTGDPQAAAAPTIRRAEIHFSQAQRTVIWENDTDEANRDDQEVSPEADDKSAIKPGLTILGLAEKAGMAPEFGCRTGVCGSCEVKLCKGKVTGGLQPDGMVRICVARPATENLEIDM